MRWWQRATAIDWIAILLFFGTIAIAATSQFVPRLHNFMSRKAPQLFGVISVTVLVLLLLFWLTGPK